jgi:hypothetical protein
VLRAISALGIHASLDAVACAGNEEDARRKAVELKVEQLEYEARRAFEQYNEVDPRNRLVADELRARP